MHWSYITLVYYCLHLVTLIYLHEKLSSVFTSVRVKIIWKGKVKMLYQVSLHKSIGEIHLYGIPALVNPQYQHESDCSTIYNREIFFKLIYSLHFYITPFTESGLELHKYTIRKALELEIAGAWKNVSTNHWLPGYYGPGNMLLQLLDILGHGLPKLRLVRSCNCFG